MLQSKVGNDIIKTYNKILINLSTRYNIKNIDFRNFNEKYYSDGVHLNYSGYKLMHKNFIIQLKMNFNIQSDKIIKIYNKINVLSNVKFNYDISLDLNQLRIKKDQEYIFTCILLILKIKVFQMIF